MQTHEIITYTIDEHPNKQACYDYVRDNWHNLGELDTEEAVSTLKSAADYFDLDLDYSICIVPDRGEFIKMNFNDDDISTLSGVRLYKYLINNFSQIQKDCPFTGCYLDEDFLQPIREFLKRPFDINFIDLISDCCYKVMDALHDQGEYLYSDAGIHDYLEVNQHQFTKAGKCWH